MIRNLREIGNLCMRTIGRVSILSAISTYAHNVGVDIGERGGDIPLNLAICIGIDTYIQRL